MKLRLGLLLATVLIVIGTTGATRAQHAQHYVLDSFGGVHAGGGAPVITPSTPYFGFAVAADIEYIPVGTSSASGDGILVLDKFGGVHKGGALAADPPVGATPYFGFDAARAIAYRNVPPRVAGLAKSGPGVSITNSGFLAMDTLSLNTPDDGSLLVVGTIEMLCLSTSSADTVMEMVLNVDNPTAQGVAVWTVELSAAECAAGRRENFTLSRIFSITGAGPHSVYLLVRKKSGSATPRLQRRTINAVYIDQNGQGSS